MSPLIVHIQVIQVRSRHHPFDNDMDQPYEYTGEYGSCRYIVGCGYDYGSNKFKIFFGMVLLRGFCDFCLDLLKEPKFVIVMTKHANIASNRQIVVRAVLT